MVDLQDFIIGHNYYNGENDDVYVYLCNAYFDRSEREKADNVFKKIFEKWKVLSNKFPQDIQKLKHLADMIISKIKFVPELMIAHFKKQNEQEMTVLIGYCIDRYVNYEKTDLLESFLEKLPYKGNDPPILFKLINASVGLDSEIVNDYLKRALNSIKDPISFLNNINFTSELFSEINPDTLKQILDLPGINTKFHHFIKFESFLESLDKIPSLDAKFFLDISNQLHEKNTVMAIQYGLRAFKKQDFSLEEQLKEIMCACESDPSDQPSISEQIMLTALKEGNAKKIWIVVDNSYLVNAIRVDQFDVALKYTAAAVKISKANSEMISKHIQFLAGRLRSIDGPEGILEGDRYKHKEENAKFNQQIELFRALYQKRTGKKFLI